jgi:hypothetical protein
MQTSQEPNTDAMAAEEVAAAIKAEETATADEEMEVEIMASIILNLRRPKQLQSRDSREHQQIREPRGTQLSSITLTLLVKAPYTDGNPALGIQVNINCTNNCIVWTTETSFLFVNYKQKLIKLSFSFLLVRSVEESFFTDDNGCQPVTKIDMFLDDVFEPDEVFKFSPQVVPKQQPRNRPTDVVPSSIAVVKTMQNQQSGWLLKVLFDSGGTKTFLNSRCLPKGATPVMMQQPLVGLTAAGSFTANRMVRLKDIVLPEFSRTKRIDEQWALIFDSDSQYDIIFGRDFLLKIGLDTCFSTRTTNWLDQKLPMKKTEFWENPVSMYLALEPYVEEFEREENECKCITSLSSIKDAKYEKVNTKEVAANQSHLTQQQREDLAKVLAKHEELFDGTLGKYPHKKIHLELLEGAEPVHQKAYPVAHAHQAAFQKELLHLVEIGVLERCGATEWGSPTFIIPKKDGRIRWVSDFRQLNAVIKRKQYPLPVIHDVLRRRSGYKFLTKIDLTMCYYTYELDEESSEMCVIVTPYGKFKYKRLPMGVKQSPDFAQEIIEEVLRGMDVETYIDDIAAFDNNW